MVKPPQQKPPAGSGNDSYSPGLPIPGYTPQSTYAVDLVTFHKLEEERVLRHFDRLAKEPNIDQRWLAIARTHLEQAAMALNRAVFRPSRIRLPEDEDDQTQPTNFKPAPD